MTASKQFICFLVRPLGGGEGERESGGGEGGGSWGRGELGASRQIWTAWREERGKRKKGRGGGGGGGISPAGNTVSGPVVEVLVPDHALDALVVRVRRGL